jgi:hypothetical protein
MRFDVSDWTTLAALPPTMPADRGRVRILDIGGADGKLTTTDGCVCLLLRKPGVVP